MSNNSEMATKLAETFLKPVSKREALFRFFLPVLATAALLMGIRYFSIWVESTYEESGALRSFDEQPHYKNIQSLPVLEGKSPIYWAELGKNKVLISERTPNAKIDLQLEGFAIASPWIRDVYWRVSTARSGVIVLTFAPETVTHAAVFMTDGDSYWRMSRVGSDEKTLFAQSLTQGRWLLIKLSQRERQIGVLRIQFEHLTGSDISVSAIAAFQAPEFNN